VQDVDVDGLGLSVMAGHQGEADFISLAKIAAGHPTGPRVVFLVTTTGGDEAVSQRMPELHGTVLLARGYGTTRVCDIDHESGVACLWPTSAVTADEDEFELDSRALDEEVDLTLIPNPVQVEIYVFLHAALGINGKEGEPPRAEPVQQ